MALLGALLATSAHAGTINWVGAGADDKWSTGANWDTGNPLANGDVLFYDDTVPIPVGAVNGTVDASYNVASMRFDNTSGDPNRLYTLQIASGTTLTSDALDVGRHDPWPDPGNANYVGRADDRQQPTHGPERRLRDPKTRQAGRYRPVQVHRRHDREHPPRRDEQRQG